MFRPVLLLASMATVLSSPVANAQTDLERLQMLSIEQERQIRLLEDEVQKLRSQVNQTRSVATPATRTAAAASAAPGTYTVKSGDTIARIARQNSTTPAAIASLNGLKDPGKIQPGQKLKLPGSTSAPASSTTVASAPASRPSMTGRTHMVQKGDTFSSIARQYGVSTQSLVSANPEVKPSALRPGQAIRLGSGTTATATAARSSSSTVSAPARTASRPAPAPAPAPAAAPKASSSKFRAIITDGEMTYGDFARKHGSDVNRLNDLNGLNLDTSTVLAKGSELYIPAQP